MPFWKRRKGELEPIPDQPVKTPEIETKCVYPTVKISREQQLREKYPGISRICDTLDCSDDWDSTEYVLRHRPTGFQIWIASGKGHLAERKREDRYSEKNIPYSAEEQELLWPYVKLCMHEAQQREKSQMLMTVPKARIFPHGDNIFCCRDIDEKYKLVGFGPTPSTAYRSWAVSMAYEFRKQLPDGILMGVHLYREEAR